MIKTLIAGLILSFSGSFILYNVNEEKLTYYYERENHFALESSAEQMIYLFYKGDYRVAINNYIRRHPESIEVYRRMFQNFNDIHSDIIKNALMYDIPVHIALAIASTESGFNKYALNYNLNKSHDIGLFQLNTFSFSQYTWIELYDLNINIHKAMEYLRSLYDEFESWDEAIISYNQGPTRTRKKVYVAQSIRYREKVLEEEARFNLMFQIAVKDQLQ